MPRTQVVDGHITRDSSSQSKLSPWIRLLLVLVPTLILICTNPGNLEAIELAIDSDESTRRGESEFVGRMRRKLRKRFTNYGVFSLETTFEGVNLHALQHSWSCSFNDYEIGSICDTLAENYCHRKPVIWDASDRVHSAHRLLCLILIISAAFFFICPDVSFPSIASILDRPSLFWDLWCTNAFVHPALVRMSTVLRTLRHGSIFATGQSDWDFVLSTVLLVVAIGNGANAIAKRVCPRAASSPLGFESVYAACLTYIHRLSGPSLFVLGSSKLFVLGTRPVTAAGIFWAQAAFVLLQGSNSSIGYSRLVAWLVAGWAGSLLAKYHLEDIFLVGGLLEHFA